MKRNIGPASGSDADESLVELAALSKEFGGADHVIGGGGNSSFKDETTLWVKPSGCFLNAMTPTSFVSMDREALSAMHALNPSSDKRVRERQVREVLQSALKDASDTRRPSVETPLHNALDLRYVLHTHPAPVNGMTCARDGRRVCRDLFPDALWVDYVDPGYTLSMTVCKEIEAYRKERSREPRALFLENHGIFVGGNDTNELREEFAQVFSALQAAYGRAGMDLKWTLGPAPSGSQREARSHALRTALGDEATFVTASGLFPVAEGPISPDHVVYGRAYSFIGEPESARLDAFRSRHGYAPRIIACPEGVYAAAPAEITARLALESADNAGQVRQWANAFGGIRYMGEQERAFIENWEGEAYRLQVATSG